ncbi:hypothetical protein IFT48_35350 [Pseudomonas fluorescens]|uniref:hypothetical protein n=1 Tax=Pseudomonas fluorescens TaxID=294 RepID=UPI001904F423|nr:hypothetical protein [Pseudomonas fluorescens]MBD8095283.1 hypothetical protein [Pseudomonas fluorescens]MBD8719740.1 hypothetical protein [Pseudomonas fluorescens]
MTGDINHKPLSQTVSFWFALSTPIVLGVALGVAIGVNSSLGDVCFSSVCINYFIEVYKVPITISGLSLPLVAMVAAVQRSKEAFVQIENGQKQYFEAVNNNRFGNFLKHREGFYKIVENFREIESSNRDSIEVLVDVGYLYIRLFPKSSFRSLEFEQELTGSWLRLSQSFERMEENIKGAMSYLGAFEMADFLKDLQTVLNILTVRLSPSIYCEYERDKEVFRSIIRGSEENIDNVIETATLALRLYLAVSSYAGLDATLARHNIFYSLKVLEMLELTKVNVKFYLDR